MNHSLEDKVATALIWASGVLVLGVLVALLGYVLFNGLPHLDWEFITRAPEVMQAGGGIGPLIFNSFYLVLLSLAFTAPIGIGAGIYLADYAPDGIFTRVVRFCSQTLASLPSVIVGLFGLLVFVNATGWGYSLMAGALTLTVLNLPVVMSITEQAVRSVPQQLREASLALGATKWETTWRIVLPVVMPGITSAVLAAASRAFGEAAALLYTSGMSSPPLTPGNMLNPFRPGETLAVHIYKVNSEALLPDVRRVADGTAAVLVIAVLCFHLIARHMTNRLPPAE